MERLNIFNNDKKYNINVVTDATERADENSIKDIQNRLNSIALEFDLKPSDICKKINVYRTLIQQLMYHGSKKHYTKGTLIALSKKLDDVKDWLEIPESTFDKNTCKLDQTEHKLEICSYIENKLDEIKIELMTDCVNDLVKFIGVGKAYFYKFYRNELPMKSMIKFYNKLKDFEIPDESTVVNKYSIYPPNIEKSGETIRCYISPKTDLTKLSKALGMPRSKLLLWIRTGYLPVANYRRMYNLGFMDAYGTLLIHQSFVREFDKK